MLIDPVCGMHMDPEAAPESAEFGDHTYYFCSEGCKEQFEQNPEMYAERARAQNPEGYGECQAA